MYEKLHHLVDNKSTINLRTGELKDLNQLNKLSKKSILGATSGHYSNSQINELSNLLTSKEQLQSLLLEEDASFLILEINTRIAGFIIRYKDLIPKLFVHPEFYGKNIGTYLLETVINNSILHSELFVNASLDSVSFYKKKGFIEEGQVFQEIGSIKIPMVKMRFKK